MNINFIKLHKNAHIPVCGTQNSAGIDLVACLDANIVLQPHGIALVSSGIAMEIPVGSFGMVCSRSGLAVKYGVIVLNAPGVIDSDYRGEVKVVLINHSAKDFVIEHGMKIAQLVVLHHENLLMIEVGDLTQTQRNTGGFGSTGEKI